MARPCSSCSAWGVKCGTKRSVREISGTDTKSCASAASAGTAVPRGGGGAAVAAVRGPLGSASAAVAAVAARMSGPN